MTWRVKYAPGADRQMLKLRKTNPHIARQIAEAITELQSDPAPGESIKMRKSRDAYRIRIENYRVLYTVHKDGAVKIVRIEERSARTYRVRNP